MTSATISCDPRASEFSLSNPFAISSKTFKHSSKLLAFAFALVFAMISATSDGWAGCGGGTTVCQINQFCGTTSTNAVVDATSGATCQNKVTTGSCSATTPANANDVCATGYICDNGNCKDSLTVDQRTAMDKIYSDSVNSNKLILVLCNAYMMIVGTGGKTLAAFAIISAGIGFFTGKVSWGLLIGIAAGIGAMFGAPSIVSAISGDSVQVKCNNVK